MNNKMGLVLSGGGGKGAYEIGVWKYLVEVGIDKDIEYVSGTSVGALNAALFAGSTYEKAESIWNNITRDQILEPRLDIEKEKEFTEIVSSGMTKSGFTPKKLVQLLGLEDEMTPKKIGLAIAIGAKLGPLGLALGATFRKIAKHYYEKQIKPYLMTNVFFKQDSIKNIIENNIDFKELKTSDVKCYATCFNMSHMRKKSFLLNARAEANGDEFITILAASSAIPIVFEPVIFEGEKYCDGGIPKLGNNTPIKPILGYEADYIIVVYLEKGKETDAKKYPNQHIIDISPSEDLGGKIDGTLNFDHDKIAYLMKLGYNDAKDKLGPLIAFGR